MVAVLPGAAIIAYVCVGTGTTRGGIGLVIALGLFLIVLQRVRGDPEQAAVAARIGSRSLQLLPGATLVYLAFQAGGFFPGPPALVGVILGVILAARLVGRSVSVAGDRVTLAVVAALAAYAVWVLLSGGWSHAPERAVTEADLAVVYCLAFVLSAASVQNPGDLRRVLRGIALGVSIVGVAAFLSRVTPNLWPIAANLDTDRVSYPLTYWNALGLVAALGIVLCAGLSSDDRETRLRKALCAAPVPVLAVTLLLTYSRGAIAAGIVGLLAYAVLARPRSLLSAAVALAPPTAYAVSVAYRATSLAHRLDGSALQASQGRHVALVVAACAGAAGLARWLAAGIDAPLERWGERHPLPVLAARSFWSGAAGVAVAAALFGGLPGWVATQYDAFVQGSASHTQLRDRLTDVSNDGRIVLWRVALKEFDRAAVTGAGAGTFAVAWTAHRPAHQGQVTEAHSLYVENLDELGLVGLGLLACALLGALIAIGRRVRKPERSLYATAFAAVIVWGIHAGIDWDWEMPAVSLPIFAIAGAAAMRRADRPPDSRRHPLLALIVLAVACVPALVYVSQHHLDVSSAAFAANDCAAATTGARSALSPLEFRHGAHEILGYCAAARRQHNRAVAEMAAAVRDDPKNWEPEYGMAVVLAAIGRDPRPAIAAALRLNPYEPVIVSLAAEFHAGKPMRWPDDGAAAPLPVDGGYGTSISGLRTVGRLDAAASR